MDAVEVLSHRAGYLPTGEMIAKPQLTQSPLRGTLIGRTIGNGGHPAPTPPVVAALVPCAQPRFEPGLPFPAGGPGSTDKRVRPRHG